MMETILVATDGSEYADKAVCAAGELARVRGARIILLHAVPDIIGESIPEGYREHADAEHLQVGDILISVGDEVLRDAETQLREQGIKKIKTVMPTGDPALAIVDYAKAHDVDLIVMGSRGLNYLERLTLGSVSHRVSQLASCNCLIVR